MTEHPTGEALREKIAGLLFNYGYAMIPAENTDEQMDTCNEAAATLLRDLGVPWRTPPTGKDDPTWLRPSDYPVGVCYDCGLGYGGPGWCDAHVPTDVWVKISPTGNEGGLLCITCMARRIGFLGIDNVPLLVGSGPWDFDTATERIRLEALEQGRKQGRETAVAFIEREAHHADRVSNLADAELLRGLAQSVDKNTEPLMRFGG